MQLRFWLFLLLMFACKGSLLIAADTAPPCVLVSVAPYKFFVEKIAKEYRSNLLNGPCRSKFAYL